MESAVMSSTMPMLVPSSSHSASPSSDHSSPLIDESATDELVMLDTEAVNFPPCDTVREISVELDCHVPTTSEKPVSTKPPSTTDPSSTSSPQFLVQRASATTSPVMQRACVPTANLQRRIVVIPRATNSPTRVGVTLPTPRVIRLQRCLPLSPVKNAANTITSAQTDNCLLPSSTNRLPGCLALPFSDPPTSGATSFPVKNGNITVIKIPNGSSVPSTSGSSSFESIKRIVPLCRDSLSKDSDISSPAKCVEFRSRPIGTSKPITLSCIKVLPTSDLAVQLLRNKSLNSSTIEKMENVMRSIRENVEAPAIINVVPRNCIDYPASEETVDPLSVVCPDAQSGVAELGALSPHVRCTTHVAVCVPASLHSTSLGSSSGAETVAVSVISPLKIAPLLHGTSHVSADRISGTNLKFVTIGRASTPSAVCDSCEAVLPPLCSVADPPLIENASETNDADCILIGSVAGDGNCKTPSRRSRRKEKPTPPKSPVVNGLPVLQLDGTHNKSLPDTISAGVLSPEKCPETPGKTSDNDDSDSDSVVIVDVDMQEVVSKIHLPKPSSPRSTAAGKVILLNHRTELPEAQSDTVTAVAHTLDSTPSVAESSRKRQRRKIQLEARDLKPEAGEIGKPTEQTLTAASAVKTSRRLKAGKRKKNDDFDWLQKRRRKTAAEKRNEVAMVTDLFKQETVSPKSDAPSKTLSDAGESPKDQGTPDACLASKTARVSVRRRQKPKTWTDDMSLPPVAKRPRTATRRKKMTDICKPSTDDKNCIPAKTEDNLSAQPSTAGKSSEDTSEKPELCRDAEPTGPSSLIEIMPAESVPMPMVNIGSSSLPSERTLPSKTENKSIELQIRNEDGVMEDVLVTVIDISSSDSEAEAAEDNRADESGKDQPIDDLTKYLLGNSSLKDVMAAQSTSTSENPTPVKRSPRIPRKSPASRSRPRIISTETTMSSKTRAQKTLDFVTEDGQKSAELRSWNRVTVENAGEIRPLPVLTDSRVVASSFKLPVQQQQQPAAEPPALTDSRQIKTSPDIPTFRENPSAKSTDVQKFGDNKNSMKGKDIAASTDVEKSSDKTSSKGKGKVIVSRRRPAGKLAGKTLLKRRRRKFNAFDDEFSLIEKDASRVVNRLKRVYGSRPNSSSQRRLKNTSASGSKSHKSETAEASPSSTATAEYQGPVVRIRGPKEDPSSCTVIAGLHDVEEETKGKKSSRKTSTFDTTCYPTSFNLNDAVPWECVFCHRGSAYRTLGDLFGPYYARPSHIPSTAALSPPAGSGTKPELSYRAAMAKPESSSRKRDSTPARVPSTRKKAVGTTPDACRKRIPSTSSALSPAPTKSAAPAGPVIPPEIWVHEDCVIWTNGTYITSTGQLEGLENAIVLSSQMVCAGCQTNGATLGCFARGCNTAYHYLCARDAGCSLDDENFRVFCAKHKNKKIKLI